ncbi:MAG: ferrochelatase [Polyangiaceae bacterium]|nr:ferrochelatase [Polyangiaceae bacterium]
MTSSGSDGVLLVAHGTVDALDDLPEFLRRIRRGRPAPPELVAELRHRYAAIGGSPLLDITRRQGARLSEALGLPVFLGMRLWRPEISEALRQAVDSGVRRLCVLPLAPYSVHVYCGAVAAEHEQLAAEWGERAPALVDVEPWGTEPALVAGWVQRIRAALAAAPGARVVLSAHSLPSRVIAMGDPYREQFEAGAQAVGAALGQPAAIAYQSQGADGGDWLGPDLRAVLERLRSEGADRVVLAPIGFLAEHVETLYDLDIEAQGWARELGLDLHRVAAPDTEPTLIEALATVARRALNSAPR